MNILIESNDDNLFWVEKRENFVKLCFAFTPELDEDLNQVDFIYTKIAERIKLDNYKIFYICEENRKRIIKTDTSFVAEGFAQMLLPNSQEITVDQIKQLILDKKCNFMKYRQMFYSSDLADLQKSLIDSIVIAGSTFAGSKDFISCPENPLHLAIYCVDIYGDNVQNIDWDIKQK